MLSSNGQKYECGTLKYSLFQVVMVFFWMLWGAMAFSILNMCFHVATPFLFRNSGLSDTFIAVALGTICAWMNTVMNPIISTASDRCRSRLGRRIPFILYTAVPTAIFLAAMPYYEHLMQFLPGTLLGISTKALVMGAGVVILNFFFLFVAILYYYLIPDVIPNKFVGRYFGLYRVAGAVAGVFWNKFLMPYVETHPHAVYIASAGIYLVVILLMCYFVREGEYAALEVKADTTAWYIKLYNTIKKYFTDCYSQKYYVIFYIAILAFGLSNCVSIFNNFFYRYGCNMDMETVGTLGIYLSFVTIISCFLSGFLVDWIGGFRASLISMVLIVVFNVLGGIFIHDYISALIWRIPLGAVSGIYAVSSGRMLVEVYPRSKFGMMASGCNLLSALLGGLINWPVGKFSEFLKNATPETTMTVFGFDIMPYMRGYRFVNYWSALCTLIAIAILLYFYLFYQKKRTTKAFDM